MSLTALALFSVSVFMMVPTFAGVRFYDMLPVWSAIQSVICLVMTVLLVLRFVKGSKNEKILSAFGMLPMIAFILDVFGAGLGLWQGGIVSEDVFILIFAAAELFGE